jgi:acyl-CoA dehydrogenase
VLVPLDTPGVEVVRDLSTFGYSEQHGHGEIAGIKVVAARTAARVIDRAIQVFGAAGLSGDTPLALFYALARQLRIVDGPDEVHLRTIARHELKRAS